MRDADADAGVRGYYDRTTEPKTATIQLQYDIIIIIIIIEGLMVLFRDQKGRVMSKTQCVPSHPDSAFRFRLFFFFF